MILNSVEIVLSFIVIMLIVVTLFLIRSKSRKNKTIKIHFEDLSAIWTRYNDDFDDISISNADVLDGLYEGSRKSYKKAKPGDMKAGTSEKSISGEKNKIKKVVDTTRESKDSGSSESDTDTAVVKLEPMPELKKEFWETCLKPYEKIIERQKVAGVVNELLNLFEKHGHHPSVVMDKIDTEGYDLISVKDNLGKITLEEHTYAVVKNLIAEIKKSYLDHDSHIPKAIIAGLAHDIGKIPEFRLSGAYTTYEHPQVSANKLLEMFAGKDIFWIRQVVKAVEEHHIFSRDNFTQLLKKADRRARQMELLKFTKDYSIDHFKNWFKPEEFMKKIEPKVNYGQTYKKWEAFSFKSIIYCKPDFLYDLGKKYCRESNILDMSFVYDSDREVALRKIVAALRKEDLVPDFLKENHFTKKVVVYFKVGTKVNMIVTPLKAPRSFDMSRIEGRKSDSLVMVDKVVHVG
jgi:hypothetical protein